MPLDRQRHAGLGARRDPRFGRDLQAVYLTVDEFFEAAHWYPIAFTRLADTQNVIPVAVMGLHERQNLFVGGAAGRHDDAYRPAYLRRHPFCTAEPADSDGPPIVCIEEQALDAGEPPLFDADGNATGEWQEWERLIGELEAARARTEQFSARLTARELLEEFEAHVHGRHSAPLRLAGMMRIAESRLQALDGDALAAMMGEGDLARVYAHLFSLRNFTRLMSLAEQS